jgi:glucose/arabinose dehydrogenase
LILFYWFVPHFSFDKRGMAAITTTNIRETGRGLLSYASLEKYALANATLPPHFFAIEFPVTVDKIRSILSLDKNRCLVLERVTDAGTGEEVGVGNVVLLEDSSSWAGAAATDPAVGILDARRIVTSAPSINHGLAIHQNYLYASSDSQVYRWPYDPLAVNVTGDMEVVIDNMNAGSDNYIGETIAGHITRTLIFDDQNRLLVSVGSMGNIDADSFRSRIRRFVLPTTFIPSSVPPIDFVDGEVFADGLRNEVGLAFDRHGVLWGVQNGPDRLNRADLGGDIISEDNPAELLHAFRQEGLHYGYPYCWMEYNLPDDYGLGPGTMWTWPTFMETITDADCRNTSRYMPAELAMQGHSAPLGMVFYEYKSDVERDTLGCYDAGSFPEWMDGYAFIAFHGSWNREVPTGYKVVYVPINATTGQVAANAVAIDLLAHAGSGAQWPDGFRPVDVDFDECGQLLVTSDGTEGQGTKVVRIEYYGPPRIVVPTLAPAPSAAAGASTTAGPTQGQNNNNNSNIGVPLPNTTTLESNVTSSSGSFVYGGVHYNLLLSTLICLVIVRRVML